MYQSQICIKQMFTRRIILSYSLSIKPCSRKREIEEIRTKSMFYVTSRTLCLFFQISYKLSSYFDFIFQLQCRIYFVKIQIPYKISTFSLFLEHVNSCINYVINLTIYYAPVFPSGLRRGALNLTILIGVYKHSTYLHINYILFDSPRYYSILISDRFVCYSILILDQSVILDITTYEYTPCANPQKYKLLF